MAIKYASIKARLSFEDYIINKKINLPSSCPECGADIEVQENGQVRCINPNCKMKVIHKYINFFSKLEIDSAGDAFCKEAASEGSTIYWLLSQGTKNSAQYIKWAHGINGDKVAASLRAKLAEPITAAKYFSLFDLEGFGEKKLDKVEYYLGQLLKGEQLDMYVFSTIEGWAETSAVNFFKAFNEAKDDIMQCKKFFNFEAKTTVIKGKLTGKSFCFTGKAEAIDGGRKACEKLVKENGGTVASSVSKTLNYLVTDDDDSASSKSIKAEKLGIKKITSYEFLDMIK